VSFSVDPRRHHRSRVRLPCVTGVPDATALIETGDLLTVDGYLDLVIIDRQGQTGGS
jgi:phosphohistidine swiveling domain-containing protein